MFLGSRLGCSISGYAIECGDRPSGHGGDAKGLRALFFVKFTKILMMIGGQLIGEIGEIGAIGWRSIIQINPGDQAFGSI